MPKSDLVFLSCIKLLHKKIRFLNTVAFVMFMYVIFDVINSEQNTTKTSDYADWYVESVNSEFSQ